MSDAVGCPIVEGDQSDGQPVASVDVPRPDPASHTDKELRGLLLQHFKHSDFKSKLQQNAIRAVLKRKHDIYISMPTGSGKSLCFQLPGLLHDNRVTVVFSPLLALIKDQIDHLTKLRIRAESINSKMTGRERDNVYADLRSVRPETRFLYITPEQGASEQCRKLLQTMQRFDRLAYFAVDEAHCVSEWGHSFRRDYLRLGELRTLFPKVPWIALTATASRTVVADIVKQLRLQEPIQSFKLPCFRSNLFYDVVFKETVPDDFKHLKEYVLRCMGQSVVDGKANQKPCGIIYCRTREIVEQVAHGLSKHGVPTQPFHSGLDAKLLKSTQEDWMAGTFPVICATIAFGMGVDKATVRFVVHWDVPQTVANYYQESGRAGRDGLRSFCRIYYCRQAVRSINHILQEDAAKAKRYERNQEQAKRALQDFQQMCTYCETVACRHKLFSNYFGDETPKCQRMCDACANRKAADEALVSFQKLSMNFYTGGRISSEDGSDLYGGGRAGAKADADDSVGGGGNSSGEEYGTSSAQALAKEQTTALLQRQFALRKLGAAKEADMQPSARLARCKASSSTAVKVAGLSIHVRDSYLSQMAELLKANYLQCGADKVAEHQLLYVDFEDVAAGVEYECFTRNKVVALYRRSCALETAKVKKATAAGEMFEALRTHVPKQRTIKGGDSRDMQQRFGDVEVEPDAAAKGKVVDKIQGRGFKLDLMTQPTLNAFFTKSSVDKNSVLPDPDTDVAFLPPVQSEADTIKIQTAIADQLIAAQLSEEKNRTEIADSNQAAIADQLIAAQLSEGKNRTEIADSNPNEVASDELDPNEAIRLEIEANQLEIKRLNEELEKRAEKEKRDKERSRGRESSHHSKSHKSHRSRHKSSRRRSQSTEKKREKGEKSDLKSDHKHKSKNEKNIAVSKDCDEKVERKNKSHSSRSRSPINMTQIMKALNQPVQTIKTENPNDAGNAYKGIKAERRSISPAETVIKEEMLRCASPASTAVKSELYPREKRADSREHDFDDELMIENLCRIDPIVDKGEEDDPPIADYSGPANSARSRKSSEFSFDSMDKSASAHRSISTSADADHTSTKHPNKRSESPKRDRTHNDRHDKGQSCHESKRSKRDSSMDTVSNGESGTSNNPKRRRHDRSKSPEPLDQGCRVSGSQPSIQNETRDGKRPRREPIKSPERSERPMKSSTTETIINADSRSPNLSTHPNNVKCESRNERASSEETVVNADVLFGEDGNSSANPKDIVKQEPDCIERQSNVVKCESRNERASSEETVVNVDVLFGVNGNSSANPKDIVKHEPGRIERESVSSHKPSSSDLKYEPRDERASSVDTSINADVLFGRRDRSADRLVNAKAEERRTEYDNRSGHRLKRDRKRKSKKRSKRDSSMGTVSNGEENAQLGTSNSSRRRRHDHSKSPEHLDHQQKHRNYRESDRKTDSDRNTEGQSEHHHQHHGESKRKDKRDKDRNRKHRDSGSNKDHSDRHYETHQTSRRHERHSSEDTAIPSKPSTTDQKLSLEDPATFKTLSLGALENRSAHCQLQLAAVERQIQLHATAKGSDMNRLMAVEQAHTRQQRDAKYARLLGTDNLDSWDDDDALSNVSAAREVRRLREERAAHHRESGQVGQMRVSLVDQMSLDDLDEPLVRHDASTAALIAAETDYEHMDLNGRLSEMENRFRGDMPKVLIKRITEEKARIAKVVCNALQPYLDGNRILPRMLFRDLARDISHRFYSTRSNTDDIKQYIRRIFVRLPCVRSLKDVAESKFL